jgi:phosphoglucomutase
MLRAEGPSDPIHFGTSGFRGRWGIEFTEPVARDIAQAICDYLAEVEARAGKVVVIGYDSREHADEAAKWCADVVLQNGFAVHLTSRDTPTPVLAYYAGDVLGEKTAGVINCTCSHNPVEWQGIKFSLHDGSISPPAATDFISARATAYRQGDRVWAPRRLTDADQARLSLFDPQESYCRWLLESGEGNCRISLDHDRMCEFFDGKLVVVDEMHGTGRGYLRGLLEAIGIPYQVIHAARDPQLGGLHAANPEEPHIQALKETVAETGAALGLGLDTDADRYGIVDRGGVYVEPNAVLAMLTHYLGVDRRLTGRVATTYVTTRILDRIAADIPGNDALRPAPGARPMHMSDPAYETAFGDPEIMVSRNAFTVLTGLKYIVQVPQMDSHYEILDPPPDDWRCRLLIGGEEASGLTTKGHVPDKDGIWACLLVLDMVAHYGKPLTEIWQEVMSKYHPSHTARVNLSIPDALKAPFIDSLIDEASAERRLDEVDVIYAGGIRGKYAELRFRARDGSTENYLQTRPSGTEPLVRVYFEATSPEMLAMLRQLIEARTPSKGA